MRVVEGYANAEVAFMAEYLCELRERVYDQVTDLPQEALDTVIGRTDLSTVSIGRLLRHLSWAECNWISRMCGVDTPDDLNKVLIDGSLQRFTMPPLPSPAARQLIDMSKRVAREVVEPALTKISNPDSVVEEDGTTVRGILMHLHWHWTYHSGHIGLLRLVWGSDYTWTIKSPLAPEFPART